MPPQDDNDSLLPSTQGSPSPAASNFPLSDELVAGHYPHPNTLIIGTARAKEARCCWLADITPIAVYQHMLYKWRRLHTKVDINGTSLSHPSKSMAIAPYHPLENDPPRNQNEPL